MPRPPLANGALRTTRPGSTGHAIAETARAMGAIVTALPDRPVAPVPGLRLRTLDGNFLAGTDHRLACLRDSGAAALPGMALVVRDGDQLIFKQKAPAADTGVVP